MKTDARQAVEWLAAAATDPRVCKRQWHGEEGTAVLACGRFWDVLSVPEELGLLALDVLLRTPQQEPGPTLADFAAHRVGFFLPPDPDSRWVGSGIRYAGQGSWIAAPSPQRATGSLRWLVPPAGSGILYAPAAVELALLQAAGTLATLVNSASRPTTVRGRSNRRAPHRPGSPAPADSRDDPPISRSSSQSARSARGTATAVPSHRSMPVSEFTVAWRPITGGAVSAAHSGSGRPGSIRPPARHSTTRAA
ncbi:hypothetical protein [Streptomyces hokutonensis]|uniref:hypothetical protein n=1 Tax=Streptomyces hokutonensis TaxID=1306990 RepID=UPI0033C19451